MPPFITQQEMDTLAHEFVVATDDLFVVTYPKCGTTWTEQIVHLILNNGEQGEQRITDAAPWLETLARRPGGMPAFLQTLTGRRLFTSHLSLVLMPDFSTTKGKYIDSGAQSEGYGIADSVVIGGTGSDLPSISSQQSGSRRG